MIPPPPHVLLNCAFFFFQGKQFYHEKKIFLTHSKLELQYVVEKTKPTW